MAEKYETSDAKKKITEDISNGILKTRKIISSIKCYKYVQQIYIPGDDNKDDIIIKHWVYHRVSCRAEFWQILRAMKKI